MVSLQCCNPRSIESDARWISGTTATGHVWHSRARIITFFFNPFYFISFIISFKNVPCHFVFTHRHLCTSLYPLDERQSFVVPFFSKSALFPTWRFITDSFHGLQQECLLTHLLSLFLKQFENEPHLAMRQPFQMITCWKQNLLFFEHDQCGAFQRVWLLHYK